MCFSRNKTCYEAVENDACHGKAASIEASSKILKLRPKLKGIYPEFQVIRGFSQKIPAGLLSYDQIHS